MTFEAEDPGEEAHRDQAATKPPESPSEHGDDSEEGGPLGNPNVDEESLRKQQEESTERSD